ncbi:hypothetical protein SDRG_11117 [Saprolegnia diclina VS20]|uniref:Protein kinase domain-containing protein n=1 Tax=Saprolegnia diclina (strain VS20) TaxID=1156394 RepID=T0RMJ3_SAPDV|nr:hypothetical protein SDRG_11117 [Saprolegnia diclina VS20]EQC31192.1 hypothetical protein SDRG_11117 [Saprolegnia diclina VS20]|eukprot:XP_008615365.1 hypothetical protein SDRG_11117 [Saprolegnia diclina VS20]
MPFWTAPEMLRKGQTYTDKADMYSFGVILIELETLQLPYATQDSDDGTFRGDVRDGSSRMQYAAVVPAAVAQPSTVHWNKRSVVLSAIMFLNVAIMPLKAYISEPLPSLSSESSTSLPPACREGNMAVCTSDLLAFFHNQTHQVANTHFFASTAFDLYHETLPQAPSPPLVASDLPYYVIYTYDQTKFASQLVANASVPAPLAATSRLLNVSIFYHALWTRRRNDTSVVDYYVGIHRTTPVTAWVTFKLVARCVLVLYLVRCMWRDYYRHCLTLATNLRLYGIENAKHLPDTAAQIVKYQDVKHKWGLLLCLWPHKGVQRAGGSVHCLFATRPEAKAVVGLSQTGTDCFIVYHTDAKTTHCVRVSLLPSIDLHRLLKEIKTNKDAAVGHVDLGAPTPSVYTGANASPWVM